MPTVKKSKKGSSRRASMGALHNSMSDMNTSMHSESGGGSLDLNDLDILSDDDDDDIEDFDDDIPAPPPPNGDAPPPPPSSDELRRNLMSPPKASPGVFRRKSAGTSKRKTRKNKMKGSKSKSLSAIDAMMLSPSGGGGGDVSEDESITEEAESPSLSSLCSPPASTGKSSTKRRKSSKKLAARLSRSKGSASTSSLPLLQDNDDDDEYDDDEKEEDDTGDKSLSRRGKMLSSGPKSSVRLSRSMLLDQDGSTRRSKRSVKAGGDDNNGSSRRSKRSGRTGSLGASSSRRSRRTADRSTGVGGGGGDADNDTSARRSRKTRSSSKKAKKSKKNANKKDKRRSAESNTSNATSVTVEMDQSWTSLREDNHSPLQEEQKRPPSLHERSINPMITPLLEEDDPPIYSHSLSPQHQSEEQARVQPLFHSSINFGSSDQLSSSSSLNLSEEEDEDFDERRARNAAGQTNEKDVPKFLGHDSLDSVDFELNDDENDNEQELPSIKEEVIAGPPSRRSLTRTPSSRRGNSCGPIRPRSFGRELDRGRTEGDRPSKRGFSISPERKVNTEVMDAERPLLSCMRGSRGKLLSIKLKDPHVQFNECLVITPIIPSYELASKRSDLWFRQKDFDKILNRSMAIALRVKEGKRTRKCVRGLEHFLRDKEERYAAWNAVLVEQEIQTLSGQLNDVRISDLYLAASTTCRTEAQDQAQEDYKAILEYMEET
ncbi:MAG: hypothetical protein SGBAC_008957 [Bacillariaceae sp.]